MRPMNDTAGVIAPPPLLYAGALGIGLATDFLVLRTSTELPPSLRYGLAVLLVIAAGMLMISAFVRFRRAGTRAEPWLPSTSIVMDGIYAFTRNPMYGGMALLYSSIAMALDSVIALLFLFPLLIVVHYGVVLREERYLEQKFGHPYRQYRQKVRRWF